jgi:uncharacterized protein YndB with AHSA1/START domain
MRPIALLALATLWALPLPAAVADSAANGFTIKTTLTLDAAPDEVYRRLVHNIADWWESAHTWSGDARNLTIEDRPAGCFCEKLPNGGGVRHMEVVFAAPGKQLIMQGGLGPLQSMAATGSMTFQLTAAPNSATKLELTYAITGYSPAGMNTLAAPVDQVLTIQLTRLKNLFEHQAAK